MRKFTSCRSLLVGQIELMPSAVSVVASRIKNGSLRTLAVTSETRSPLLPDVPTMAEAG
ncbi:MAG: tripartite tricarboxylate transporter substrate-binding protein [Pseudomonadota bacterium]